jgi:hypothetical protein
MMSKHVYFDGDWWQKAVSPLDYNIISTSTHIDPMQRNNGTKTDGLCKIIFDALS